MKYGEVMKSGAETVRAFIAIELPNNVKEFLEETSSRLKRCGADVKWVRTAGMHLTLKFLGYVKIDVISIIQNELQPLFEHQISFPLMISSLGAFPALAKPRVIWSGLDDPNKMVTPLVSRLEDILEPLGFKSEKRPFTPHLTLGRVRSNKNATDLIDTVRQSSEVSGPSFIADHAVLFESVLKPTGAEYFVIRSFDFSGSKQ
jgi:RNA 2',3'-cyclic 3'-phosphodiesterase